MPSSSLGIINSDSIVLKKTVSVPDKKVLDSPQTVLQSTTKISIPQTLLLRWNFAMFIFHSTLSVVTFTVGKFDLKVQLYKTVLDFKRRDGVGWDLIPEYVPQGFMYFTILTGIFFMLSALFHLMNATLLRNVYLSELEHCRTPTRWIEYTFSAPIMIVLVAYTLGIRERALIFAIAILICITMPFGYWVEIVSRPKTSRQWSLPLYKRLFPWMIGHIPQVAAWIIILVQFYDVDIGNSNPPIPWFVYLILWFELVLFFSFGIASVVSQWSEPQNFYKGELLFQVLSLISKGLLGIILLSNVLMLSQFEDIYNFR
jgi:hypothetical protein